MHVESARGKQSQRPRKARFAKLVKLIRRVEIVWRSQTPTARAGGSGVLSIRDFVPLECNALRNTYRNREARH